MRRDITISTIKIGYVEKPLDHADDHWIDHEIKHQRQHNRTVCVLVRLVCRPIDMILSTPGCGCGGGGGRPPTAMEREIFEEWNRRGLNGHDWSVHSLINFLHHIRRFC